MDKSLKRKRPARGFYDSRNLENLTAVKDIPTHPVIDDDITDMIKISAGYLWTCADCPALFTDKTQLSSHKENSHNFACILCGDNTVLFESKHNFVLHYATAHGNNEFLARARGFKPNRTIENVLKVTNFNTESNNPARLVKCELCKKYLVSSCLVSHSFMVHNLVMQNDIPNSVDNIEGSFDSDLCEPEFKKRVVRYCSKTRRKVYNCSVCKDKFKTVQKLRSHYGVKHSDVTLPTELCTKKSTVQCAVCDATFNGAKSLYVHMNVRHKDDALLQKLVCCICGTIFTDVERLRIHEKQRHNLSSAKSVRRTVQATREEIDFKKQEWSEKLWDERGCRTCNKLFVYRRVLVNHMELVHGVQIQIENDDVINAEESANKKRQLVCCEVCGLKVQQRNMKHHLETHTSDRECKYKCSHCDKPYKRSGDLHFHIESTHSEGQVCTICGMVLRNRRNLKRHVERLHNPNVSKLKCQECDREFVGEDKLRRHHSVVHLKKVKQHVCQFCGKKFTKKNDYVDHINLHTKEKTYVCEICFKVFNQLKQVKHHQRMKHGIYTKHGIGTADSTSLSNAPGSAGSANHSTEPCGGIFNSGDVSLVQSRNIDIPSAISNSLHHQSVPDLKSQILHLF